MYSKFVKLDVRDFDLSWTHVNDIAFVTGSDESGWGHVGFPYCTGAPRITNLSQALSFIRWGFVFLSELRSSWPSSFFWKANAVKVSWTAQRLLASIALIFRYSLGILPVDAMKCELLIAPFKLTINKYKYTELFLDSSSWLRLLYTSCHLNYTFDCLIGWHLCL